MTVTAKNISGGEPLKARELMNQLNVDAEKINVWVRTELNAPAQRAWFTDTGGNTGAGELAAGGRVSKNQVKALPHSWRWNEYSEFLKRIGEIASRADVSPIRQAKHPADQPWSWRKAAGDQHHAVCDFDLQSG